MILDSHAQRISKSRLGAAYSIAQRRSLDGGITWSNVTFPVGSSEYMVGNPSSVALANGSSALPILNISTACHEIYAFTHAPLNSLKLDIVGLLSKDNALLFKFSSLFFRFS